jgi:hypothetical protein
MNVTSQIEDHSQNLNLYSRAPLSCEAKEEQIHSMPKPVLSLIAVTRDDSYNNDTLQRLSRMIDCLDLYNKHTKDHYIELIVVDYLGRNSLLDGLRLPESVIGFTKFFQVIDRYSKQTKGDPGFNIGHAQNLGFMHSSGMFVGVLAYDLLHSLSSLCGLIAALSRSSFDFTKSGSRVFCTPRIMLPEYVAQLSLSAIGYNELLESTNSSVRRIDSCIPIGSGAGMIIIDRMSWGELGGTDERFEGWGYHDNDFILRASRTHKIVDLGSFGVISFKPMYSSGGLRKKLHSDHKRLLNPRWINDQRQAFRKVDSHTNYEVIQQSVSINSHQPSAKRSSGGGFEEATIQEWSKSIRFDDLIARSPLSRNSFHPLELAVLRFLLEAYSHSPSGHICILGCSPLWQILEIVTCAMNFSEYTVVELNSYPSVGKSERLVDIISEVYKTGSFGGYIHSITGHPAQFGGCLMMRDDSPNPITTLIADLDLLAVYSGSICWSEVIGKLTSLKWVVFYSVKFDSNIVLEAICDMLTDNGFKHHLRDGFLFSCRRSLSL